MKLPKVARVLLMACALLTGGLSTQAQDADAAGYRLVYSVIDDESKEQQLISVDLQGNTSLLSSQLFDWRHPYSSISVSPDLTKIAGQDPNGDLVVLNAFGEVIARQELTGDDDEVWNNWHVWGWRESEGIVVSHIEDDYPKFYELTLETEQATFNEIPYLNEFFVWRASELNGSYHMYQPFFDLFVFSPDFRYVAASSLTDPDLFVGVSDDDRVKVQENVMVIWDLKTNTRQAIENAGIPWFGSGNIKWSNSSNSMAFHERAYDPGESIRLNNVSLFNAQKTDFKVLLELECDCDPKVSWSPSDKQIAVWKVKQINVDLQFPNTLVIIDTVSREQQILLSEKHVPGHAFWSPDEHYIAFGAAKDEMSLIYVIDVETGDLIFEYELGRVQEFSYFLGWIATP
jgi:hypothetical protein